MLQNIKNSESLKAFTKERVSKFFKYSFYFKMYPKAFLGEDH